jgi:hypothetical protein
VLEERREVVRHLVVGQSRWRIDEDELDVVGGRKPDGVAARLERRERRSPAPGRQKPTERADGRHGRSQLDLVFNQTSHDQLSARKTGERLGDGKNAVEPNVVAGKDEHNPIRLDGDGLRQVEGAILGQDRPFELAKAAVGSIPNSSASASRVFRYTSSASVCLPDR